MAQYVSISARFYSGERLFPSSFDELQDAPELSVVSILNRHRARCLIVVAAPLHSKELP